jgi:hypothetical protein
VQSSLLQEYDGKGRAMPKNGRQQMPAAKGFDYGFLLL